jgi:ArsR family transcriptional regulator, arsenate/arsenite/antimonite-responsive transcriptional repressor
MKDQMKHPPAEAGREVNGTVNTTGKPIKDLLTIFKALSDETRLRILKLLEHGELCVCDMVAAFDMIQPRISFHLSVLKQAGFLRDRKDGKWMHYSIDDSDLFKRLLILSVIEKIPRDILEEDTKRLEEFLANKAQVLPLRVCCARKQK